MTLAELSIELVNEGIELSQPNVDGSRSSIWFPIEQLECTIKIMNSLADRCRWEKTKQAASNG